MLDNVLTATVWPLPEQAREAASKRRIGLGFTGLGDALIMLGLRYDSAEARAVAADLTRAMRDTAYRASVGLAREKGAFPLFDAEKYLASGMALRLPEDIRAEIRAGGMRNSHLLSIAPTGTISLAFADNASNGIEPAYSWTYTRKKREADGSMREYPVEDHAWRLWRARGGNTAALPPAFVNALEIAGARPHEDAGGDPALRRRGDLEDRQRARGLPVRGLRVALPRGLACRAEGHHHLSAEQRARFGSVGRRRRDAAGPRPVRPRPAHPHRRRADGRAAGAALAASAEADRRLAVTGPTWSRRRPTASRCSSATSRTVTRQPFEVWVNGEQTPRGLAALAKNLSMDMRAQDRAWLRLKLESLEKTPGTPFAVAMPPDGRPAPVAGAVSAFAKVVQYRCAGLGLFDGPEGETPLVEAMFSRKEPKSGVDGTLSWTVDILNPTTGDDFAMFVKECVLPDGSKRPFSVWLSGAYPIEFNGLTKSLSLDMRVIDPAWIGKKLRGLKDLPEAQGDFFARVPGSEKQAVQPSTIAYVARLLIHRYEMLGVLDHDGYPTGGSTVLWTDAPAPGTPSAVRGRTCPECGHPTLIRRDGCDFCTSCGYTGACG